MKILIPSSVSHDFSNVLYLLIFFLITKKSLLNITLENIERHKRTEKENLTGMFLNQR